MTTENKELQKLQSLLAKQYYKMEKLGWEAEMIEDTTEFLNTQFSKGIFNIDLITN